MNNKINYLSKNSFHGLKSLQILLLRHNLLSTVPSKALEAFTNCALFHHLDLSSNRINGKIENNAFAAVSSSLTYLNLKDNNLGSIRPTIWLNFFQKLDYLFLGDQNKYRGMEYVFIALQSPLQTLHTFEVNTVNKLFFKNQLCSVFPNLEMATFSDAPISEFPSSLALHMCSTLKELDLSGSIDNINSVDLELAVVNISSLHTLKMAKNKLTSVKQILFIKAPKLTTLDLSGNQIEEIDTKIVFAFPNIRNLNVEDIILTSISGVDNLKFLQTLYAAGNQITEVPSSLFSNENSSDPKKLDLRNNPFQCTCKIETFRKWILSDTKTWLIPGQYACATPNSLKGRSITALELDCRSKVPFYLSTGIPCAVFFCMIIVLLIRYRWHIKYKLFLLYRNYRPFPDNEEEFEMLQLQYHAYVAYNETTAADDDWVLNNLQPNMEEGPNPVKLCIKSRDFIPGHSLIQSIDDGIHRSRKTILVLSPYFVESEWCYHEMQMAQMRLLDDNLDVLILVLLGKIPENKMTLSLRQLLCHKEYLKWPKDRPGQRLFWEQLRQEIKNPIQIDRCFHFWDILT